ncbi:hypothetical protein QNI16_27115 [Cytophagaceae bacterium YF14B1]|uniref:Adhesin domain-containing protein n=1 Tax=Xanthocytophaga flava TaxID=3048013 RepID=A0AAE3U8N2_9BACT|nr:hypothetical protein [Xanthocytophaga flavus]MDJ1484199.1 hypothetical protein [Xanthocytophaga flavus]
MKYCLYLFVFFWSITLSASSYRTRLVYLPSDTLTSNSPSIKKIEINLRTQGGLQVVGSSQTKVSMRLASQSSTLTTTQANILAQGQAASVFVANTTSDKKLDTLISRLEATDGIHIFSKDNEISHQKLQLAFPTNHSLSFQLEKGDIELSDLSAFLDGDLQQGNAMLTRLKGNLRMQLGQGNLMLSDSELEGTISVQKGNVTLQNLKGNLAAFTQDGTITRRYSSAYCTSNQTPLSLQSNNQIVEIETLPYGGNLFIANGSVKIEKTTKTLILGLDHSPAQILSAEGTITLTSQQSDVSLQLSASGAKSTDPVDIRVESANLTLAIPASFQGKLVIIQQEDLSAPSTEIVPAVYLVENGFAPVENLTADTRLYPNGLPLEQQIWAGKARPQTDQEGRFIGFHTYSEQQIGAGNKVIRLWVHNGNLTIRKI